jgi:hypothetical protein
MLRLFGYIIFFYLIYIIGRNLLSTIFGSKETSPHKKGSITISQRPGSRNDRSNDEGEYIDYKEVK